MPVPNFTVSPNPGVAEQPVTFTDTTAGEHRIVEWSFPNGNPSTADRSPVQVTWSTAGTYTVVLTVARGNAAASKQVQVTVSPPSQVDDLQVVPTEVTGTERATGTVRLSAPAPSAGKQVALSTNNSSVAQVPQSITIPAGQTTGTFQVTTSAVSDDTQVAVGASGGGGFRSTVLTVKARPPTPSQLSVNPGTVTGGTGATGTVTLTSATRGSVSVALSCDNSGAQVPASVDVPDGQTSATFPITTTSVSTQTSATISASVNGITRTAVLTVMPSMTSTTTTTTTTTGPTIGPQTVIVLNSLNGLEVSDRGSTGGTGGMSISENQWIGPRFSLSGPTSITEIGGFINCHTCFSSFRLDVRIVGENNGRPDLSRIFTTWTLSDDGDSSQWSYERGNGDVRLEAGTYFALVVSLPPGTPSGAVLGGRTSPPYQAGSVDMAAYNQRDGSSTVTQQFGAFKIIGLR